MRRYGMYTQISSSPELPLRLGSEVRHSEFFLHGLVDPMRPMQKTLLPTQLRARGAMYQAGRDAALYIGRVELKD